MINKNYPCYKKEKNNKGKILLKLERNKCVFVLSNNEKNQETNLSYIFNRNKVKRHA